MADSSVDSSVSETTHLLRAWVDGNELALDNLTFRVAVQRDNPGRAVR